MVVEFQVRGRKISKISAKNEFVQRNVLVSFSFCFRYWTASYIYLQKRYCKIFLILRYCIRLTTVSTIIVTVSIVSFIIAKPVSNQSIYNISSIKAGTFSTLVFQNTRSTAVSTIVIAVSIVCLVITETISNNRGSESSNTVFLMMTYAIRAMLDVVGDFKKRELTCQWSNQNLTVRHLGTIHLRNWHFLDSS